MKIKLTKKDIDRAFPPREKEDAIEQSARYEQEYESSRKELDEMLKKMDELLKKLEAMEKDLKE
jgi:hypothetical protein